MENVFYLNKDLHPAKKSDIVAIAYYFKDDCNDELYQLGQARFEKIVEIIFLDPIGHRCNRYESFNLKKIWGKKNYPQYHSVLPSENICRLIRKETNQKIDNCWTRSYDYDGGPQFRKHGIIFKDGDGYLSYEDYVADNVFVSLVLTKEEFLKINPDIKLSD